MRQVGAGSLGDGRTFNEITATCSGEADQRQWRLEIRTINLTADKPNEASSFVLLNPATTAKSPEQLALDATRKQFDSRVRSVMRQFSGSVYRTQPEGNLDKSTSVFLPQSAIQIVESIIREVVFPRLGLRVRLFLEEQSHTRPVPKLSAVYLAPPSSEGPNPVKYPVSLAALSLVLGKTLSYPEALDEPLDDQDYEWLRRSRRDRDLDRVLEALVQETLTTSYPGPEEAKRYDELRTKLARWMEDRVRADPLSGKDFYQVAPQQSSHQMYPNFICVPFPQRAPEGVPAEMPEVAVLVVSVNASEEVEQGKLAKPDATPEKIFTPERIGMLESLAELTGMILIASSALGKPKGVWDERFRV